MNIYIGADHGGFALKNELKTKLADLGYSVIDVGAHELDSQDDYPDFAFKVAEAVAQEGMNDDMTHKALGILICRSGNGMCVAANKINGAYAILAFNKKHAEMARIDDNANIICLDADYEGEDPLVLAQAFLKSKFAGIDTRHGRRFNKIVAYEKQQ